MYSFSNQSLNQDIVFKGSDDRPEVTLSILDKKCRISGKMYFVDPEAFFNPLLDQIDTRCLFLNNTFKVEFHFTHINSSSVSYLLKFIRSLLAISEKAGSMVSFQWHIDKLDVEMAETALIFNEILGNRIEILYGDERGQGLQSKGAAFSAPYFYARLADNLLKKRFSRKYNQEIIVFNPLFFTN